MSGQASHLKYETLWCRTRGWRWCLSWPTTPTEKASSGCCMGTTTPSSSQQPLKTSSKGWTQTSPSSCQVRGTTAAQPEKCLQHLNTGVRQRCRCAVCRQPLVPSHGWRQGARVPSPPACTPLPAKRQCRFSRQAAPAGLQCGGGLPVHPRGGVRGH